MKATVVPEPFMTHPITYRPVIRVAQRRAAWVRVSLPTGAVAWP